MALWKLLRVGADYNALSKQYGIDPVVLRIMRNKNLQTPEDIEEYLHGNVAQLDHTEGFADMDAAVNLLTEFKQKDKKIRVIGDYDVDGVCATVILYKGLKAFGMNVDYAIPHRIADGYGLNENLIMQAYEKGIEAIITCDNGISAHAEIKKAVELGITMIVTDHHEIAVAETQEGIVTEILPEAEAVINPKRSDTTYSFCDICGAYVAYKLIAKLLGTKDDTLWKDSILRRELLEFAAFGTVCDVMPLIKENRTLVKYGLELMENSSNIGLAALIKRTGLQGKTIRAYHLGFVLGPCINATGRLDSATRSLELLLCEDVKHAEVMAEEIVKINESRKIITQQQTDRALEIVAKQHGEDKILILYLPDCHESIAGIIAGRVREVYYRPTLVFTDAQEGIKGSGRSIEAYDMYKNLSECKELFTKFGGHKMAAGVSMPRENLPLLRDRLNAAAVLTEEDLTEVIQIDVDLPFGYVNEAFMADLERLEPFGMGNARPVFAQRNVTFCRAKLVGEKKNVAFFAVRDEEGRKYELKYFGDIPKFHKYLDEKFGEGSAAGLYDGKELTLSVIYNPEFNTYNGRTTLQYVLKDYS